MPCCVFLVPTASFEPCPKRLVSERRDAHSCPVASSGPRPRPGILSFWLHLAAGSSTSGLQGRQQFVQTFLLVP